MEENVGNFSPQMRDRATVHLFNLYPIQPDKAFGLWEFLAYTVLKTEAKHG